MKDYKDFEILVTAEGEDFFARVLSSPAGVGVAQHKLELPFDQNQILLRLENAILRSVKPVRSSRLESDLRAIGDGLFRALLTQNDEMRLLYSGSRNALVDGSNLRVKLRIEAESLGALPWEYFYDDLVLKDYLGLDAHTSLVRYVPMAQQTPRLSIEGPVRILGMAANPRTGTGVDFPRPLDVTDERARIDKAIGTLHESGEVNFQWVAGESYDDLFAAMYKGPWHVFHFVGHGGVDESGEGFVMLAGESGAAEEYSASKLLRVLRLAGPLRLVILNCCDSARGSSSLAQKLILSGIPAVLAMQFPISDQAAIEFSSAFYFAIASGEPVDGAVTHARIRMQNKSPIEWGIPVLYMRAADGRIFDKPLPSPDSPTRSALAPPPTLSSSPPIPPSALVPPRTLVPPPVVAPPSTRTPPMPTQEEAPHSATADLAKPTPAPRFDTGSFSILQSRADEPPPEVNTAFFVEYDLASLARPALDALLETGQKLRIESPGDDRVRKRLAKLYYETGKRDQQDSSMNKAFANISSAIDLDGSDPEFFYDRANIYARLDQFEAATGDIQKAIDLSPRRGELHWAKGVIALLASRSAIHQEQLEVAVEAFSEAISCEPAQAKYYSSRGAALSRLGEWAEALTDLERAIELDPSDAKNFFNRGHLRLRQGDNAGAIEDFRGAAARGYALANVELQRLLPVTGGN
jgi:Flp pilus assembly protein TadD